MITKWNFQTPTEEELHKRDKLASELELSPVVCLLLVQRGLSTVEEVKKFFKPSLNDLHDPFLMPDMEKAVKRLNKALGNKEKILIYGDYDVDGTTAVSLVYKYYGLIRRHWIIIFRTGMTKDTGFRIKASTTPGKTGSR